MFVVATSVEGDVWNGLAGIFSTRDAAERFRDSVRGEWSYEIFPVSPPREYPFFLTSQGVIPPAVRYIAEDELRQLLAEVPSGPREDRILFNVYSVTEDSVNRLFPGEPVLPKLRHYHVMAGRADLEHIRKYLFR